jgi:hypothetical protein
MAADSCANELFAFDNARGKLDFPMSKLFVDLNRTIMQLPPRYTDGLIKTETAQGRAILEEGVVPDEIAISNMVRRYYDPYHEAAAKIIATDEIRLIVECHTIPAVGLKNSAEADSAMPLVRMWYVADVRGKVYESAPKLLCNFILSNLEDAFRGEQTAAREPFVITEKENRGELVSRYSGRIPYIRLDICKSLFLNESYFNPYYLKVDQIRIKKLREKIWNAIEKGGRKFGII